MLSCKSIKSRSEYGSSSPRPNPPVATIANPLVAVTPISVAFVVSQKSCKSSSASRSAAESNCRAPPESNCSDAAAKSVAGRNEPAAGASHREAPAALFCSSRKRSSAECGVCSVISTPPPAFTYKRSRVYVRETTSHFRMRSKGVGTPFSGAYPDHGVDGADPHLAVADLAGTRGLDDDIHHLVDGGIIDHDLNPHLRHEVDGVLSAAVHLGVTLLATVALNLADGHPENTRLFEARLDVFERERLDDRSNQLHIPLYLRAVTGQYRTATTGDRGEVVSGFSMLRLVDAGRLILRIKT